MKLGQNRKVLLVEDDESLAFVIQDNLEEQGFHVSSFQDGTAALRAFFNSQYDLCILDVMLPKMDGFALAEEIRKDNKKVPIIFLTARAMKEDKIKGFRAGADDYITKPFSLEELELRIEVLMKRVYGSLQSEAHTYKIGHFTFNYRNLSLAGPEEEHTLTQKEGKLLRLLAMHKNELLTREKALEVVWGEADYFAGRSMDVYISKLRKYLKSDPSVSIENLHGVGFKLIAPGDKPTPE